MSAPDKQLIERVLASIEATAPNANEGLVFTYGQVERGLTAALSAITPPNEDEVRVPRQLYDFLMGEGSLDGVWFGDDPLLGTARGAFWWRKALSRAALAKEKRGRTP